MKRFLTLLSLSIVLVSIQLSAQTSKANNMAEVEDMTVYPMALLDESPEFIGGSQAMYQWLGEHINYPAKAAEEDIQGRVIIEFVISTTGEIENVKVLRGRHEELDKEAVRLVKAMPKWKPGKLNGKTVRCTYTLPITFKLTPAQKALSKSSVSNWK